jgi:signal transduction histidine kinase
MVAARLDPAYFSEFFSKLDADAVALVDRDGNLYARFPAIDLIAAPARPLPMLADRIGDFTIEIPSGDRLLGHAAAVPGTGMFVRASSSERKVLEAWVRRSSSPVLGAIVASLGVLAAMRLLRRRTEQMEALVAARDADARAASAQATRFRAVARNKSDFLAHMGHELRTPLNAIIGFADVLRGDAMKLGLPARYREYAGDIAFSAGHLLDVINRVLDMSKLEAGKWKLELGRVDAAALLATVAHLAAQRADKEGVLLVVEPPEGPVEFTGDGRVAAQLLLNLTINAIKFAGTDRRVRLACRRLPDGRVEFRVADRGPGMTPEDAERALRPFETASDAPAPGRSETGLGLPLARMFAELHGGTLELDTAPGRGTTVRVVLPVAGPQAVLAA